jgi:site-specific DNA-methyltransferase (adenine-specific)
MKLLPSIAQSGLLNNVHCIDAFELCRCLPPQSVDMILTDPPYGVHEATWDKRPDLDAMWQAFKRVIKPRGAIVMTASQPFDALLICSNLEMYKYSWVWVKSMVGDFFRAKLKPLRLHEMIVVFSPGTVANCSPHLMRYYPQGLVKNPSGRHHNNPSRMVMKKGDHIRATRPSWQAEYTQEWAEYPSDVLFFPNPNINSQHINQKPVALFEYLIRTYTQPGDVVLDPYVGSGTTAVAARNLNRRFVCGDTSPKYVAIARKRLAQPFTPNMFEVAPAPEPDLAERPLL